LVCFASGREDACGLFACLWACPQNRAQRCLLVRSVGPYCTCIVCAPVVRLLAHGLAVQVCAMMCGSVQRVHMFPQPPGRIWHAPRALGAGMLWSRTLVSRMTSGSISHHATSDFSRACAQTSPAPMCVTIARQCCTHRRLMYSYIYTSYIC